MDYDCDNVPGSGAPMLGGIPFVEELGSFLPVSPAGEGALFSFVGTSKGGKSFTLRSLLYEYSKINYFQFGIAITGKGITTEYEYLPGACRWGKWDEGRFRDYIQDLETAAQRGPVPPNFIILDDLLGVIPHNAGWFKNWISLSRSFSTYVFITMQNLTQGASTTVRLQTDFAIMFHCQDAGYVKMLYEKWGMATSPGRKFADFQSTLHAVTSQSHTCLFYNKHIKTSAQDAYKALRVKPPPAGWTLQFPRNRKSSPPPAPAPPPTPPAPPSPSPSALQLMQLGYHDDVLEEQYGDEDDDSFIDDEPISPSIPAVISRADHVVAALPVHRRNPCGCKGAKILCSGNGCGCAKGGYGCTPACNCFKLNRQHECKNKNKIQDQSPELLEEYLAVDGTVQARPSRISRSMSRDPERIVQRPDPALGDD